MARGALVAWGDARRRFREARFSRGCERVGGSAGLGVKVGSLIGDSLAGMRFFGRGVAGGFGAGRPDPEAPEERSCGEGLVSWALRFFGTAAGLESFVDFAMTFVEVASTSASAALLATLADRRRDMFVQSGGVEKCVTSYG